MAEHHPRPEITEVESQLLALKPSPGSLDRDRVIYRAGRASALGPGRWAWPAVSGVMSLVTVALAVALATRPEPTPRVVYVKMVQPAELPKQPPEPGDAPSAADELLPPPAAPAGRVVARGRPLMEEQLLRWGLDALPAPAPAAPPAEPANRFLGVPVGAPPVLGSPWLSLFAPEGRGT
jgi:hypothetical protein